MSNADIFPHHGGQLGAISRKSGIPAGELLDFSANINPDGPPSGVIDALLLGVKDPATLTSYPDLQSVELRHSIADYIEVRPDNIVVANGFVPLLKAPAG